MEINGREQHRHFPALFSVLPQGLDLVFVPRSHVDLDSIVIKIDLECAAVYIGVSNQVNNRKGTAALF